jgi:hypothetical protein
MVSSQDERGSQQDGAAANRHRIKQSFVLWEPDHSWSGQGSRRDELIADARLGYDDLRMGRIVLDLAA